MSRFLSNIFIVFVLCLSLSVIPINANILNLEIKITTPKLPVINQPVKKPTEVLFAILTSTPANTQMTNPSHLAFEISSQNIKSAVDTVKKTVTLEVLKDDNTVKTISLDKLKLTFEQNAADPTRGRVLVPISFKDLSLLSGKYTLAIKSENENCSTINGNKYPVFYLDDKIYLKAMSPGKYRMMTLFVADSADEVLIPVTRFTYTTKSLTRLVLAELAKGPKTESGLHFVPSSLYGAKATLRNGKVTLNFTSDMFKNIQMESASVPLTLQAIMASEFAMDFVQSVTMTVDDTTTPSPDTVVPPEITLGQEILRPVGSKLFTGYINNSSYLYLVPIDTNTTDINTLFEKLKAPVNKAVNSGAFVQPVPAEINLVSQKLDNGVLTLDLSRDVLTAFSGNENYINLMLDAIGNTMTSLTDVKSVVLTSGGVPIQKIGNVIIPKRLIYRPYLNPEKYDVPPTTAPTTTSTTPATSTTQRIPVGN